MDDSEHLSGYGDRGQEPSLILINYGTNDALKNVDAGDLQVSIKEAVKALRRAAPLAKIVLIIPFGQYEAGVIKAGLAAYQSEQPLDHDVHLIDLGQTVAEGLVDKGFWAGVHPNMRGHAVFASRILGSLFKTGAVN